MKMYAAVNEYGDIFITTVRKSQEEVKVALLAEDSNAMTHPRGMRIQEFNDGKSILGDVVGRVLGERGPLTVLVGGGVVAETVWPEPLV